MKHWNVIVTIRGDYNRAVELLRGLGPIGRTGLYNVVVMRVPDVGQLLDRIAGLPPEEQFFAAVSHVVPVTHRFGFMTAEELEQKARDLVLAWAPVLAGKSFHVRMRRRGRKGEIHGHELERQLGGVLLEELARRGTPGRIVMEDPDAIIAIETIHDEAGLALWTREELERYPFLRASIERPARPRQRLASPTGAPPRPELAASRGRASQGGGDRTATAGDLADLLGELDPLVAEKLLATGATVDEVAEAVSAIEDEDAYGEIRHELSSPRAAEVRALLEEMVFEELEPESEAGVAR